MASGRAGRGRNFQAKPRVAGYGLGHPDGGILLTLRHDPGQAAATAGRAYFEMSVPGKAALDEPAGGP